MNVSVRSVSCTGVLAAVWMAVLARRLKANGETAATICKTLGIDRTTLYRYLSDAEEEL